MYVHVHNATCLYSDMYMYHVPYLYIVHVYCRMYPACTVGLLYNSVHFHKYSCMYNLIVIKFCLQPMMLRSHTSHIWNFCSYRRVLDLKMSFAVSTVYLEGNSPDCVVFNIKVQACISLSTCMHIHTQVHVGVLSVHGTCTCLFIILSCT